MAQDCSWETEREWGPQESQVRGGCAGWRLPSYPQNRARRSHCHCQLKTLTPDQWGRPCHGECHLHFLAQEFSLTARALLFPRGGPEVYKWGVASPQPWVLEGELSKGALHWHPASLRDTAMPSHMVAHQHTLYWLPSFLWLTSLLPWQRFLESSPE